LTGTPDQTKDVARHYRVFSSKTSDSETDYLIDHSIIVYLMDRNGQFLDYFGINLDANQIADRITNHIKSSR